MGGGLKNPEPKDGDELFTVELLGCGMLLTLEVLNMPGLDGWNWFGPED